MTKNYAWCIKNVFGRPRLKTLSSYLIEYHRATSQFASGFFDESVEVSEIFRFA
jgi:hypothetical protein